MRRTSFQIALPIFHPMLFQEHINLFLERHLAMMFGLALNIFRGVLDARNADTESAITLLPLEAPMLIVCVVNPFR